MEEVFKGRICLCVCVWAALTSWISVDETLEAQEIRMNEMEVALSSDFSITE